jgi:hypothetical protein
MTYNCHRCQAHFAPRSSRQHYCPACISSGEARLFRARTWYAAHREAVRARYASRPEVYRANHLRRKYGMTAQAYTALLAAQAGLCAICHRPPSAGKPLCVDHNHASGKVRAIICRPCNFTIGLIETGGASLSALSAYLCLHNGPGFQIPDNRPVLDHSSSRYLFPPTSRGCNPLPCTT